MKLQTLLYLNLLMMGSLLATCAETPRSDSATVRKSFQLKTHFAIGRAGKITHRLHTSSGSDPTYSLSSDVWLGGISPAFVISKNDKHYHEVAITSFTTDNVTNDVERVYNRGEIENVFFKISNFFRVSLAYEFAWMARKNRNEKKLRFYLGYGTFLTYAYASDAYYEDPDHKNLLMSLSSNMAGITLYVNPKLQWRSHRNGLFFEASMPITVFNTLMGRTKSEYYRGGTLPSTYSRNGFIELYNFNDLIYNMRFSLGYRF